MIIRLRFFFTTSPPTELYTLSLHDALPIFADAGDGAPRAHAGDEGIHAALRLVEDLHRGGDPRQDARPDRKSTRLNSSHVRISYAVFCLKKKNIAEYKYTKQKAIK